MTVRFFKTFAVAIVGLGFMLNACTREDAAHDHDHDHDHEHHDHDHAHDHDAVSAQAAMPAIQRAVAVMYPTAGNTVQGTIHFTQEADGVRIVGEISGLTPGDHGFHIHEFGDCSKEDGTSAGGHFNPEGHDHGGPDASVRHHGDLGNLTADASGNARYNRLDKTIQLGGAHSILGRSIIIHAGPDDLITQPTGDAGARVACGTIGVTQ